MILIFSSIYTLHQALPYDKIFKEILASLIHYLESTDAVARALMPHLSFFFFFLRLIPTLLDLCQHNSIHAESASIHNEPGWFGQNRAVSAISDRIGRQLMRPKQAEISLETCRNSQNYDLRGLSCLLLSLFCESRHSNVFFKNILIVKIYRKYK